MLRSNSSTANRIVKTCLMFAVKESAQVKTTHKPQRTGDCHTERTRFFVGRETDYVKSECDAAVDEQSCKSEPSHLVCAPLAYAIELAAQMGVKYALDEREWAHSCQQIKRVQC